MNEAIKTPHIIITLFRCFFTKSALIRMTSPFCNVNSHKSLPKPGNAKYYTTGSAKIQQNIKKPDVKIFRQKIKIYTIPDKQLQKTSYGTY